MNIEQIQRALAARGLYPEDQIDGIWGNLTEKAWQALLSFSAVPVLDPLVKQLRRDEGEVLSAYQDHLGFWTIGIGRLIDKRKGGKITPEESAYLLSNDIKRIKDEVDNALPWVKGLTEARSGALYNMAFQMGTTGLLGFKNTLAMVQVGDYVGAARGMLNSLWAKQTPERAKRIARQMEVSEWQ